MPGFGRRQNGLRVYVIRHITPKRTRFDLSAPGATLIVTSVSTPDLVEWNSEAEETIRAESAYCMADTRRYQLDCGLEKLRSGLEAHPVRGQLSEEFLKASDALVDFLRANGFIG
jgi:hypothetical protein